MSIDNEFFIAKSLILSGLLSLLFGAFQYKDPVVAVAAGISKGKKTDALNFTFFLFWKCDNFESFILCFKKIQNWN